MKKRILSLGKVLSKEEQKNVFGGGFYYNGCYICSDNTDCQEQGLGTYCVVKPGCGIPFPTGRCQSTPH